MNIKKILLLTGCFNSLVFSSFNVAKIKEIKQSISEVNLPIEKQKYLASFFLTDNYNDLCFELFVVSAQEKDNLIFVHVELFKNEDGILIFDCAPTIVLTWEQEVELRVTDDYGTEWVYLFYADLTQHAIKVKEVFKDEETIQEWNYTWNIESSQKVFFDSFIANDIQYSVVIKSAYLHDKDCIAFQWNVFTNEHGTRKLIDTSTIEGQWEEEYSFTITDKSGNNLIYSFFAQQW